MHDTFATTDPSPPPPLPPPHTLYCIIIIIINIIIIIIIICTVFGLSCNASMLVKNVSRRNFEICFLFSRKIDLDISYIHFVSLGNIS